MSVRLFKLSSALSVDQCGRDIRKGVRRISTRKMALRLNEDCPTRSQAAQGVIQATRDGDEFSRHCAIQVRSPELRRPLERAVLVQDDPLVDQGGPRQEVGKTRVGMAVFGKVHHIIELRC